MYPSTVHSTVRIAIRSDRRLFRESLAARLDHEPGLEVVGHVSDVDALIELCGLSGADVILFDLGVNPPTSIGQLGPMHDRCARAHTVVVYDYLTPAQLSIVRRSGVDTLIPASHGVEALLALLRKYPPGVDETPAETLTDLERELIALTGAGHTTHRIAELLELSPTTVENVRRGMYHKLKVGCRSQAVARAMTLGISIHRPVEPGDTLPALTAREWDILRSIADGHTVRQTARALGIATKTVENTQARLFRKLGVHNRVGALGTAHALGLL